MYHFANFEMNYLPLNHISEFLASYADLRTFRLISKTIDDAANEQCFLPRIFNDNTKPSFSWGMA